LHVGISSKGLHISVRGFLGRCGLKPRARAFASALAALMRCCSIAWAFWASRASSLTKRFGAKEPPRGVTPAATYMLSQHNGPPPRWWDIHTSRLHANLRCVVIG